MTAEERADVAPGKGERFRKPCRAVLQPWSPEASEGLCRRPLGGRLHRHHRTAGCRCSRGIWDSGRRPTPAASISGTASGAPPGSFEGHVLGSYVQGSASAIARTQRSPARYYQRPDAGHVRYDDGRTSLGGGAANFGVMKFAGSPWRLGTGFQTRTPGVRGERPGATQRDADYFVHWVWGGYQRSTPQGPFRNWSVNLNAWNLWNYDRDRTGTGGNLNLNFQLLNFWYGYGGVNQELGAWSDGLLRGGPLFRAEARTNFWAGFGSDARKPVRINVNSWGNVRPESDSWSFGVAPTFSVRPSGRATFSLGARLSRNSDDRQWVRRIDTGAPNYLFARIDQTTGGLTARLDYAFTPDLSLQVYAQPFVGSGSYREFKRVADPRAKRYADRFEAVEVLPEGDRYRAELDGSRVWFGNPDFSFRQFRSNTVLRWEYSPGSVLYFVWSQGRNHTAGTGEFDFTSDLGDLFGVTPDNVFMVKLSYWLSR